MWWELRLYSTEMKSIQCAFMSSHVLRWFYVLWYVRAYLIIAHCLLVCRLGMRSDSCEEDDMARCRDRCLLARLLRTKVFLQYKRDIKQSLQVFRED
jgi:hypothetical protein